MSRAGFNMEYWRITDWHIRMTQNLMDITLTPYVSSQTREDGLEPINEEIRKIRVYDDIDKNVPENSTYVYTENFSPQALENAQIDIYKLMYEYIKNNVSEFEGAKDC